MVIRVVIATKLIAILPVHTRLTTKSKQKKQPLQPCRSPPPVVVRLPLFNLFLPGEAWRKASQTLWRHSRSTFPNILMLYWLRDRQTYMWENYLNISLRILRRNIVKFKGTRYVTNVCTTKLKRWMNIRYRKLVLSTFYYVCAYTRRVSVAVFQQIFFPSKTSMVSDFSVDEKINVNMSLRILWRNIIIKFKVTHYFTYVCTT